MLARHRNPLPQTRQFPEVRIGTHLVDGEFLRIDREPKPVNHGRAKFIERDPGTSHNQGM